MYIFLNKLFKECVKGITESKNAKTTTGITAGFSWWIPEQIPADSVGIFIGIPKEIPEETFKKFPKKILKRTSQIIIKVIRNKNLKEEIFEFLWEP